jgi:hypothetical protein
MLERSVAVDWPTSGNARCRPTPKFVSVVNDGRKATPFSVGLLRRKGHFKRCRESESGGLLSEGSHGCAPTPVEPILGSINPGRVDAQTSLPQRGTRVHRMRQPRYRLLAEERLNQAQVIFSYWFISTVTLSLHAAKDGQSLTLLSVSQARMAPRLWV